MQRQKRINAPQCNHSLNSRNQQFPFVIGRQSHRTVFELLSCLGQQRLQLLTPPDLSPQKSPGQKPRVNPITNLVLQPPIAFLENRARVTPQLLPPTLEIFDEQRLTLNARHDPRHHPIRKNADDSRQQRQIKRDVKETREQSSGAWPGMKQQHHTGYRAKVNMGQHPVTQCAGAPPVNLLPKWIRHHNRDTHKPDDSRQPTQRQPCACEHAVESIFAEGPEQNDGRENRQPSPTDVPCARKRIALVNVPSDRVSLIAKDESMCRTNLTEVLNRINAH